MNKPIIKTRLVSIAALLLFIVFPTFVIAAPPIAPNMVDWKQVETVTGKGANGEWHRLVVSKGIVGITWFYQRRGRNTIDAFYKSQLPKMLKRYAGGNYTIKQDDTVKIDGIYVRRVKLKVNGHIRRVIFAWAYSGGVFRSAFIHAKGVKDEPNNALSAVKPLLKN